MACAVKNCLTSIPLPSCVCLVISLLSSLASWVLVGYYKHFNECSCTSFWSIISELFCLYSQKSYVLSNIKLCLNCVLKSFFFVIFYLLIHDLGYLTLASHTCSIWQLNLLTAVAQPQFSQFEICCYWNI